MDQIKPLTPDQLYRHCDVGQFSFETTADLEDISEIIGQVRALDAAQFGLGMRRDGYNLYVMGPSGSGKETMVRYLLEQRAASEASPFDWCYVHNFSQPHKPRVVRLTAGLGARLRKDMKQLVEELSITIPAVFEADEYAHRLGEINNEFGERQSKAFNEVGESASKRDIVLLHTANGFSFAPAKDGEVVSPEDFAKMTPEEQQKIEHDTAVLQEALDKVVHQVPRWRRERLHRVRQLNEEVVLFAVGHMIEALKEEYADFPVVKTYLDEVQQNIIERLDDFRQSKEEQAASWVLVGESDSGDFSRFRVNLLVDHGDSQGAPIIGEDHPTYQNLIGRTEYLSQMGTLVTDFMQIKPGALHLANGGYLLLDAVKLLTQPFSWEALKRALSKREVRIESFGQMYGLVSTVSLEPEPIQLDVKVVVMGNRLLYYMLAQYDPEFSELFKVSADFEDEVPRNADNHLLYARLIATLARRDELRPFDRHAVARTIEHCARRAEDAEKLSTHMESLADLVRESDFWAGQNAHSAVTGEDVERAIEAQIHRADRLRDRSQEAILRGTVQIDTTGVRVGQINGLAVFQLGQFAFGQPSRITASTRLGSGVLIDIQREIKLGGAIHSKGVLILSSYLGSRYTSERPLSLSASLVFEQTYGMVEGDSASMAELCALLSSLAAVPIRQSLAVTGSVDQFGRVQAIGAVNEKIEGFFEICSRRGLTGEQGVIIPETNLAHLMLRRDVIAATAAGNFHIYPVKAVDQALELLTGMDAGEPDAAGVFPDNSFNRLVAERLHTLAEIGRRYGKHGASVGKGADGKS